MKSAKRPKRDPVKRRTIERRPRVRRAQRIALLVDSENLEITVRQYYDKSGRSRAQQSVFPDWKVIMPLVVANRTVVRTIYYKERGRPVSQKFRNFWESEFQGEIRQPGKAADPYIIVDAISLSEKVDAVVLFTGDQDYLPLIAYLKAHGCRVEVATFYQSAAREMRTAADIFHRLTKQHTISLARSTRAATAVPAKAADKPAKAPSSRRRRKRRKIARTERKT